MKIAATILGLIIFLLTIIFAGQILFEKIYPFPEKIEYGVTFSPRYAGYLKLDWQKTYIKILDELKVKNLRLPSYWDILEKTENKYDFSETDFMLSEASKRGAKIILVLGARQPRWPESQYPAWARKLSPTQRQQITLKLIQKVTERYLNNQAIWAWQMENEPFAYWFGENCDSPDSEFLKKEIAQVKKLDTKRPIIVTDNGEWGSWIAPMKVADITGISIYKKSYNSTLGIYTSYPFMPWMYNLKSFLVRKIFAPSNQKTIIAELQTEPWLSDKDSKENSPTRESQLFSLENFKANVNFAQKTGFKQGYLWGVEWWYFMEKNGHPEYLQFAKTIFR